ncbi:MAG: Flp family type IVb pilin [Erythrobacter sp.]
MEVVMNGTKLIASLWRDQAGATAIEYGLIASLIVLGIMGALRYFASAAIGVWEFVSMSVAGVVGG